MVLGNSELLEFGIESKYGLRYQMQHGVLADGLWFEGTVHYHYFALYACMTFEKFAHGTAYSLEKMGIYEKMFAMKESPRGFARLSLVFWLCLCFATLHAAGASGSEALRAEAIDSQTLLLAWDNPHFVFTPQC